MNPHNIQFGQKAIELGLLSREQAHYCLQQCAGGASLLDVAASYSYLSQEQAQLILSQSQNALQHPQAGQSQSQFGQSHLSSSISPEIGYLFQGYQVTQILGQGGMGTVFKVEKDSAFYALKTILPDRTNIETLARFEREALAAASVDMHQNIVSVHKLELKTETPFIVMDFVDGQGLDQIIKKEDAWSLERVFDLLRNLGGALDHMHSKGVIHRDLKPANILIRDHDGAPMITDFGLAKEEALEALTRTGEMLGTPSYMAPEQFLGEACSTQTDVWAFAVIAFELLSGGHRPFAAESSLALAQRAMLSEPTSLLQFNPDCTNDIETVIFKALRKKADDRYERCGLFVEDFGRAVRGEAILGRREGFLRRKSRLIHRKLGAIGVAVLAILVLTVLGMGGYYSTQARKAEELKKLQKQLQKNKKIYRDHIKQHILWQLGVKKPVNKPCASFHKSAKDFRQSAPKNFNMSPALYFLPCDPDFQFREESIIDLKKSARAFLRAYFEFKSDQYQRARTSLKGAESGYYSLQSNFLNFAIACKLEDYSTALSHYDGTQDSTIPREIRARLDAHKLIAQLKRKLPLNSQSFKLFKGYHQAGERAFIEEWGLVANAYFNELLKTGTHSKLFSFHQYHYELQCSNNEVEALTVTAAHLRKMLRSNTGSIVNPQFLVLHYRLQQLDPSAQSSAKMYRHLCKDGRIDAEAIQASTRRNVFMNSSKNDKLMDLLYFCSRAGIYVENFRSVRFILSFSKSNLINSHLDKRPWDPALKFWRFYYKTPSGAFQVGPSTSVEALTKSKIYEEYSSVIESSVIPSVYKSLLLRKRARHLIDDNNLIDHNKKAAIRELVLKDLRASYKIGHPCIYRTGMIFRQAMTFGLSPEQIKAQRKPLLDQFEQFNRVLERQIKIGAKPFMVGDTLCYLDPLIDERMKEIVGALKYEWAQAHNQLAEYEQSLKLLLSFYKHYMSESVLRLLSNVLRVLSREQHVAEVLKRAREIIAAINPKRKPHYIRLANELENHFKNRK